MSAVFRSSLDVCLSGSPLQSAFWLQAGRKLTVIAYHDVEDPDTFADHLAYISRTCRPISADELILALSRRSALPRRAVLITFDDAGPGLHRYGMDLLMHQGIPSVAFVVAGVIDSDTPYWWEEVGDLLANGGRARIAAYRDAGDLVSRLKRASDEVRIRTIAELKRSASEAAVPRRQLNAGELQQLESAGVEIGNHTLTHPCLPGCSDEKVRGEIKEAHDVLTKILGHRPRLFAYPNGDWDRRAAACLRDLGYQAAFLFNHRLSDPQPVDPLAISRVRVDSRASLARFKLILSGLHPTINRVRRIP